MYRPGSASGVKPQSAYTWCASAAHERGPVGDRAGEADLAAAAVEAEVQRVRDGALHHVAGHAVRPVRTGDEPVHHVQVEPPRVVVDLISVLSDQHAKEPKRLAIASRLGSDVVRDICLRRYETAPPMTEQWREERGLLARTFVRTGIERVLGEQHAHRPSTPQSPGP